jgi:alpha-1,6-mannosyltransferase
MPSRRPESGWTPARRSTALFAGGAAALVLGWLIGFSLRVPLWDADAAIIARPIVMSRVFPGGISSMTNVALILALTSAGYLVCLWALRSGFRNSFPAVIAVSTLAVIVLLPMRPLASPDVTHLAADVRTFWLHRAYPAWSQNAPGKVDDPIARQVLVYTNGPSGYGPLAYGLGGLALPFVGNGLAANVAGQKAVAGLFLVLTAFFTGLVAKRLGKDPALPAAIVGLNPMMLFVFAGDGHDDSIMVAFAVAALLFVFEEGWRHRGIGAALAVGAVLSKFALVLSAPVVLAAWFPRWRRQAVVLVCGIGVLVLAVFALRYGPRIGTLGPATAFSLTVPQNVVGHWVDGGVGFRNWVVFLSFLAFLVLSAAILWAHPLEKLEDRIAAVATVMWVFVYACSPQMLPWYQFWYLPFAALSGRRWLVASSLVFSLGAFGPILALHWASFLSASFGWQHPVDPFVLLLWAATGATALGFWWSDRSPMGTRRTATTRQTTRAMARRRARGRA